MMTDALRSVDAPSVKKAAQIKYVGERLELTILAATEARVYERARFVIAAMPDAVEVA